MDSSKKFRLPAEWEPQEALWLTWPQNKNTWGKFLPEIETLYYSICNNILNYQDLYLLVNQGPLLNIIRDRLGKNRPFKLHLLQVKTNDCWIRDYGGITVTAGKGTDAQRIMLNWKFNSWGEKYPPWRDDDEAPKAMAQVHKAKRIELDYVLEGGAIEVNGKGRLLTTEQCLLHKNRNPEISRLQMEETLNQYLGVDDIIWLHGGIAGDDSDGHIDNLVRFVNEQIIFCTIEENKSGRSYTVLKRNSKQLELYAGKRDLEIVEIPAPPSIQVDGVSTPASYANFLILNGAVLVPVFSVKRDEQVLALFEKYFPRRKIIPVDCRLLSYGLGGIHCISMQVPKLT